MSKPNAKLPNRAPKNERDSVEIIELAINDIEQLASAFRVIKDAFDDEEGYSGESTEERTVIH